MHLKNKYPFVQTPLPFRYWSILGLQQVIAGDTRPRRVLSLLFQLRQQTPTRITMRKYIEDKQDDKMIIHALGTDRRYRI
ncbi:hypothetical protein E1B28_003531 [Marasmius oreades]|uniref:Uncharacterized protein n=1 Tax=Marasmius oreades TaxID=181124 RepID=A0A9P7RN85_9AGAR|nr:uncharacterized protein E1B28_003531 [Marasmius oreades]KAG7086008.1 hypothetical protein E1B28_003531 [Marasmius oreades]